MATTHNHFISLEQASKLTKRYRELHPDGIISEFFYKDAIMRLLALPDAKGLRVYYGQDPDDKDEKHLVLMACKQNEKGELEDDTAVIVEAGYRCPPHCSSLL